ncbi:hypothetical protein H5410_000245 [Solanum commersonii]|uniref:Uncharacterized protein n=1 Tax=Solanum commersonii TaxID=4109 RepID=A0A9J6AVK9_SOLCO|nr:hypothetical protein H5410_000245 [Solanum commersonii]
MSLDFSPLLKHFPFMQYVWRHFAEQDCMLNGTNIWNLPVYYNKLCFEAVDSGAKDLPFSR